jgi:hypothetical protein
LSLCNAVIIKAFLAKCIIDIKAIFFGDFLRDNIYVSIYRRYLAVLAGELLGDDLLWPRSFLLSVISHFLVILPYDFYYLLIKFFVLLSEDFNELVLDVAYYPIGEALFVKLRC